jgi:hypothetical protein
VPAFRHRSGGHPVKSAQKAPNAECIFLVAGRASRFAPLSGVGSEVDASTTGFASCLAPFSACRP